uniref:PUA domain-containing protein n=1 Tax=Ignisphaera aggregans TaxID=334771 RepID=A0A7C2VBD0_9CREN
MQNIKIRYMSKKAAKNIISSLESRRDIDPSFIEMLKEADEVRVAQGDKFEIVIFNSLVALFKVKDLDIYMPTLYAINMLYHTKKMLVVPTVVVDEGAVDPLKRGAHVMVPGIRKILRSFSSGDIVAVMDPSERYFIVVGIALVNSSNISPGTRGKGIRNISHLDDNIWQASLHLAKAMSSK